MKNLNKKTSNIVDTCESKVTRIALFANHLPGVRVAEFFAKSRDNNRVEALYLVGEQAENDKKILSELGLNSQNVFFGSDVMKSPEHIKWFREQQFDAIICVYWPWLLTEQIFSSVKTTVNFHPALLPINRGWFPHVHSIIDGSKTGVTLHQLENGADTGAIWAQKEIAVDPTDTAKEIYLRLQSEIVALFMQSWEGIKSGLIKPLKQDESIAVYHSKKEIEGLDQINIDKSYRARDLINILRARTFGDRGFAYFEEKGEKIYIKIELSKTSKF